MITLFLQNVAVAIAMLTSLAASEGNNSRAVQPNTENSLEPSMSVPNTPNPAEVVQKAEQQDLELS